MHICICVCIYVYISQAAFWRKNQLKFYRNHVDSVCFIDLRLNLNTLVYPLLIEEFWTQKFSFLPFSVISCSFFSFLKSFQKIQHTYISTYIYVCIYIYIYIFSLVYWLFDITSTYIKNVFFAKIPKYILGSGPVSVCTTGLRLGFTKKYKTV